MAARVLVVGHVTHDRYGDAVVPGGCAYYGALAYANLGADYHLACGVGTDFVLDADLRNIPHTIHREGRTTVFTNLYPANAPRIQLLEEQAPMLPPGDLDPAWLAADLVHLAPVLGEIDLAVWKAASRAKILGLNVQGFIKRGSDSVDREEIISALGAEAAALIRGRRVVQAPWDVTVDELRGVDVACCSDEDLIGQGDLLERLREAIPIVALTHGVDGSTIFHPGGIVRVGIVPNVNIGDLTGAGDTYAAGFLNALASGENVETAARIAAAAASIVIEARGAESLGRLGEARARAELVPVFGGHS